MKKASDTASALGQSLVSIIKLIAQSKPSTAKEAPKAPDSSIIIMGNGPSLRDTLASHMDEMAHADTMAVNFAPNSPEFFELKPKYYILIDPLFFADNPRPDIQRLWKNLARIDWDIVWIVAARDAKRIPREVLGNAHIKVKTINNIGVEGWRWLENMAYDRAWGMPRPRNVLIAAIMAAIFMGYKNIYIVGADFSWFKDLHVDDDNQVLWAQTHFYKDEEHAGTQQKPVKANKPIHMVFLDLYITLRSYHQIQRYAAERGISVFNATPGSQIDAFPRKEPW